MIKISIPGHDRELELKYLLLDLNGTLTVNGILPAGVKERLEILRHKLDIFLLTADTYGTSADLAKELGIEIFKVSEIDGGTDKKNFLLSLEPAKAAAIGNGYNDVQMLSEAGMSIVIMDGEGCAVQALLNSDIAVTSINDALDLLINPIRIIATLRS